MYNLLMESCDLIDGIGHMDELFSNSQFIGLMFKFVYLINMLNGQFIVADRYDSIRTHEEKIFSSSWMPNSHEMDFNE